MEMILDCRCELPNNLRKNGILIFRFVRKPVENARMEKQTLSNN